MCSDFLANQFVPNDPDLMRQQGVWEERVQGCDEEEKVVWVAPLAEVAMVQRK